MMEPKVRGTEAAARRDSERSAIPHAPRRRWMRFSMRALLALVFFAAMPLWWLRVKLDDLNSEHRAIETLRSRGIIVSTELATPRWLWRRLPKSIAPFRERGVAIHSADVAGPVTAADMLAIGRLTRLGSLEIEDSSISDDDLAACSKLKLWHLRLVNCRNISGDGLRFFAGDRIEEIDLRITCVGDQAMAHIAGFSRLHRLDLRYTRVTDGGMAHVLGLKRLWNLYVPRGVTSRGLRGLETIPLLSSLCIWLRSRDDVAATKAVCSLPHLEFLEVSGDELSGAGFGALAAAPRLKCLEIHTSRVNEAALARLKTLPRLASLLVPVKPADRSDEDELYANGRPIWRDEFSDGLSAPQSAVPQPKDASRRTPHAGVRERLDDESH